MTPSEVEGPGLEAPRSGILDLEALGRRIAADSRALAEAEPRFAPALAHAGWFPVRLRAPGFPALVQIILDQQVSTRAAEAMWRRLCSRIDPADPAAFLALDDATLKACGFSRQKARYARLLAEAILAGTFDPTHVHAEPGDEAAIARLTSLTGIGRWSAECYLLFVAGRRDVLPAGDLALQVAWQWLGGLQARPSTAELAEIGRAWSPYRTAAAYLLWGTYLQGTARKTSP